MFSIPLLLRFLALLGVAYAYVIPIRRIKAPSNENRAAHPRHARFVMKDPDSAIAVGPSVITLLQAGSASQTRSSTSISTPASTSPLSSSTNISTPLATQTASLPGASPVPSDSSIPRKYVVAHHMIGNTFPYNFQDWADDISLAHQSGIDGFALNVGKDDWQPAQVSDAYAAALQSGLDFKLFLSLDMTSLPCSSPNDAQTLRNLVNAHISHPNHLEYDSRAFVSTFSGETCTFGQGSAPEGWKTQFLDHPELAGKVYFVPAFFIDPAKFNDFRDVLHGDFNWNSGWPIQVTTSFAKDLLKSLPAVKVNLASPSPPKIFGSIAGGSASDASSTVSPLQAALSQFIGSTDSDKQHLDSLAALSGGIGARDGNTKRAYMAAASPWFFTHYSPESFNKNFIFLSDQHLYSKRWESLVASRDQFDIVQILTWNDYGESHYIGPIKGAQPNSEAWVNGMEHTGWLQLTQYYAIAFKTGKFPEIAKDKIFMWSRPHPCQAQAQDPVGQPTNFELSADAVWAVVMTTAPSVVTLSTSSTTTQTFNVPAGLTKLSIPITAGGIMKGTIERNGQTVVELNPQNFSFQGSPKNYNFNAFVATATAT